MEFTLFIVVFVILFALGLPVGFTMIVSSLVYGLAIGMDLSYFILESFGSFNTIALVAIPMFVLTSEVMNESSVSDKLFNFSNSLVGWIPGGLAHTNVINSIIFAGMSGSALADVGGIGLVEYKAMKDRGFDPPFAAAVTCASSVIGPIIPPSIPVIIYAMVIPAASVGALFLGGVIPGLIMGLFMMIYIFFIAKKRKYPIERRLKRNEFWPAIRAGILPVLTPAILLLTITLGMVTVSEGAVITVVYTLIIGTFIYRKFGIKKFWLSLKSVAMVLGPMLIFLMASKMFSFVLAKEHLADTLSVTLLNITKTPFIIMLIVNVFFLVMGCLSDPIVNIILFAPLAWSVASPLGFDPTAFGIVVILNTMIGIITPPIGGIVFAMSGLTKVPIQKIFKEVTPFIIAYIIILVLLSAFPSIITFIPNLAMGR